MFGRREKRKRKKGRGEEFPQCHERAQYLSQDAALGKEK